MEFGKTKSVYEYLNQRYKRKIFGETMRRENEIVRALINDHSIDDLNRMRKRLEGSLSINKTLTIFTDSLFSLISTFVNVFVSIIVSMVTVLIALTTGLWGGKKISTNKEMTSLIHGFSPIFNTISTNFGYLMVVALVLWFLYYRFKKWDLNRRNNMLILVDEAIESYSKWKITI